MRVDKDEWHAESDTGEVIPAGKEVEVVRVEGTHLVVKVLQKEV
jgi:membrane protein implicated in regulation of membrane protease activity